MAPIKSSLARTVGKLLGVQKDTDLSLRGDVQSNRLVIQFTATGGSSINIGSYTYHVYTSTTPSTFEVSEGSSDIEVLVVAGGGGGGDGNTVGNGGYAGGGGGAGGIAYAQNFPIGPGTYPIAVGAGGAQGPGATNVPGTASDGGNSSFDAPGNPTYILARGGGGGGGCQKIGNPGGSGGGSGRDAPATDSSSTQPGTNPSPLVTDYGFEGVGSDGPGAWQSGGGGGGAGAAGVRGSDGPSSPGNAPDGPGGTGGNGQPFPGFPGPGLSPVIPAPAASAIGPTGLFGGGGGSSSLFEIPSADANGFTGPFPANQINTGGSGGGGRGAILGSPAPQPEVNGAIPAGIGIDNTGGGGGGGSTPFGYTGQDGGDGIVIIRYLT